MGGNAKERTCIVCRKTAGKGGLLRVVRSPEGQVSFDPTGRAAGRGAYVCSMTCCEKACKAKAFDRALRVKLTDDDRLRIGQEMLSALTDEE